MQDNEEENTNRIGAPLGNTNSNKNNRLWADTIRRACIQADGETLRLMADALLQKAIDGDISALREVGDRLDGKATQTVDANLTGDLNITEIIRKVV